MDYYEVEPATNMVDLHGEGGGTEQGEGEVRKDRKGRRKRDISVHGPEAKYVPIGFLKKPVEGKEPYDFGQLKV